MNANQVRDMQSAMEDARVAARLSAETIAAQQAEIRRLEGETVRLVREHALLAMKLGRAQAALEKIADNCIDWTGSYLESYAVKALEELDNAH